jgi:opacity protein-like surface antigen
MKRLAMIAVSAALLAAPALAQQQQQQSPLGQTLQNLGRALQGGADQGSSTGSSGLDRNDRSSRQDAYDRAYRDNSRSFSNYSEDELRRADRQIAQAWTELQAASKALDDEMDRRRTGSGSSSRDRSSDRGSDRDRGYDRDQDRDRSRR